MTHQIVPTSSGRGRPRTVALYRQAVLTLVLLRSNIPQCLLADLSGISPPTPSRIHRTMLPLIEQVTSRTDHPYPKYWPAGNLTWLP